MSDIIPTVSATEVMQLTVHQRMACILSELPAIGKDAFNQQQSFHYRSHDDVLNALNPLLAKWGVFVVPHVLERITGERRTRSGGTMYEVNLHVQYTFFGLLGDSLVASAWGEGTDSGDKSTNKAMTMAFKNVLAQSFAVSTADTIDSDAHTPEETTGRAAPAHLRELEALIEAVKAADQDPAHEGGYWYQVAVNAAAKYHNKTLDDLAPGEVADLENRFRGLLKDLAPAAEVSESQGAASETELPIQETEVRKGPEGIPIPSNWAEIEAAIRAYGDGTWADFWVFADQAKAALFPGAERMSPQRKNTLFQKAAGVTIALREAHDVAAFPPPVRVELQAHWAKALGGTVLEGPEWAMSPDEVTAGRPPRPTKSGEESGDSPQDPEEAEAASTTSAAPPSPDTFTDTPLTDNEQEVLNAVREEFPDAVRMIEPTEADRAALEKAPSVEVGEARD